MAITCGFFNSKNGDRKYNAEQMGRFFDKLITSGVFPNPSTQLQVVAKAGMTINVLPGRAMLDCHWLNNDSNLSLTLAAADVVLNRIDAVVMKLDLTDNARTITIEVKKGANASNPVAPSMTRNDYVKEYALAYIRVNKLVTSITQAQITDCRADTSVCGWVTSLIEQVDTSTLFKQWQTAYEKFYNDSNSTFDEWFQHIRDTISTAGTIKVFRHSQTATTQDQKVFSIGIAQYNNELDVLNVFINGFKLIKDVDYTSSNNSQITLIWGVDSGTRVDFEALKHADI